MEGAEFPDIEAAQTDALAAARELLVQQLKRDGTLGNQQFEICDETGQMVAKVPFRDAMNSSSGAGCGLCVEVGSGQSGLAQDLRSLMPQPHVGLEPINGQAVDQFDLSWAVVQKRGDASRRPVMRLMAS